VSASLSTLVASPASIAADGTAFATLVARAVDASGAPLQGRTAVFHVGGSSNTLTAPSAVTGTDGSASAWLSSTHAETKAISVTIDGIAVLQQASVILTGGEVATLDVVPAETSHVAGVPFSLLVTARDAHGNVATGFGGSISFSSTDPAASLPAPGALVAGTGSFESTLRSAGPRTLSAAAIASPSVSGTSSPIAVTAAAAALLQVTPTSSSSVVGASLSVGVTARDAFGNVATGYADSLRVASTDPAASLPVGVAVAAGTGSFAVTLRTLGAQTISTSGVGSPAVVGTSGPVIVNPSTNPGAPALVQHVASTVNPVGAGITGNAFVFTLPNPVLAGNALILGITYPTSAALAAVPVSDTGGTWPTSPAATQTDSNGNVNLAVFVLPGAAAGTHTITVRFTAPVIPFQYVVSEFSHIATSSPVSGSAGASGVAAPDIHAGTFTPGNNDANGGNLIWAYFRNDSNPGSGNGVVTFAAGDGFTLLDADIAHHAKQNVASATQYQVQASTASITPRATATMAPGRDQFIGVSIALRAASAGTAPAPSGIRVIRINHNTFTPDPGPWTIQFPTSGNLLVLATSDSTSIMNITGISDSRGNSWRKIQPAPDEPQVWVATSATPDANLKIVLTTQGNSNTGSFRMYDITGAADSPVGAMAGVPSTNCSGLTTLLDFPAITPTARNGLTIVAGGLGQGPGLGLGAGAPAGATWDLVNYAGETDLDLMENADLAAHHYDATQATQHWNWNITAQPSNSCFATAVHFLPR
jgi:hypothetical protein